MNRMLGMLGLALAVAAWGGTSHACDKGGSAAQNADCAAKHADHAASHADCAATHGDAAAGVAGHECGMKAEECAQHMKEYAQTHGWLGIGLDMNDDNQMTVDKVWPGSPAEKAGFRVGDRIVSLNGLEAGGKNLEKIHGLMRDAKIGDTAMYVVARGSENVTLQAVLAMMPADVLAESIDRHMKESHSIAKN